MGDWLEQVVREVLEAGVQTLADKAADYLSKEEGKSRAFKAVKVLLDKEVEVFVLHGK